MQRWTIGLLVASWLFPLPASGQANGKLQIHHLDVGQGDGALLISPNGQIVLFDVGKDLKRKTCTKIISYLARLGVKRIDALFVSHYHSDHIGCIAPVLARFPLTGSAYDRGSSYASSTYDKYTAAVRGHRKTASVGLAVALEKNTADEVTISVVAVNGSSQNGDVVTSNENDLSVAVVVSYGQFREEIGGDLSGDHTSSYRDVESPVASGVGHIDVYKVHHHCSAHSTNQAWLRETTPTVGIISTGSGNSYRHPAPGCLARLRTSGLKRVYWTQRGSGGDPEIGIDVVGGNILVEVSQGGNAYTVTSGTGAIDAYDTSVPGPTATNP